MKKDRTLEKQLSLLDLETQDEPSPRIIRDWHLFRKNKQRNKIQDFKNEYGEDPIFWRRLNRKKIDIFFTSPDNAVVIDLETGELITNPELLNIVWKLDVEKLNLERKKHLSAQVIALLNNSLDSSQWQNEIIEILGFIPEHKQKLIELFKTYPVNYCFEKEEYQNKVRVFGDPAHIQEIFKHGMESGILK